MRALGVLVAGAVASLLLLTRSPLAADDPLRGTLAVVPLAVALLTLAQASLRRGKGQAPAGSLAATQGARLQTTWLLAAVWLILLLVRPILSLPGSERFFAASLYFLFLIFLASSLASLRRSLGERVPLRPPAAFFLLPLALYLLLLPWSTEQRPPDGDEPWFLLTAHSLAYDFDADLSNNYAREDSRRFVDRAIEPQPGDPRGPDGQVYSRHPLLLSALVTPAYRLGGKAGALALMAVLAAAVAWMTLRLSHHYWPTRPGEAILAWCVVAFTPPLLLYSYQLWVEVPAALALLLALDRIKLLKERPARAVDWLLGGAVLLVLVLLKLRLALVAAPLVLVAAFDHGVQRRRLIAVTGALATLATAILLYNWQIFGNALRINSWRELLVFRYSLFDYVNGLAGLFFDVAFGLFASAPIWVLILPAAVLWLRKRSLLARDLTLIGGIYVLMIASRPEWYGGWSPPFRYPLVLLPLLGLGLVPLFADRRAAGPRAVLGALAAATVLLSLLWIAVPGWTYNFADGRNHLLDHLSGQTGLDLARFFPSATRPRLATYLWPVLLFVSVNLAWRFRPRTPLRRTAPPTLAGIAVLLLGCAAVPYLARQAPTARIEVESPYVQKSGGHPDPDPWVVHRTRFPEAWVLREGDRMSAPVIGGGKAVSLALDLRYVRNHPADLTLRISSGGRELATVPFGADDHDRAESRSIGPVVWRDGERLDLEIPAPGPDTPPGVLNGLVIDRIRLAWGAGAEKPTR